MIKHRDSHVDHGLTEAQLRYLLARFADREAFFLKTIELPEDLGTVPCGLYGPIMNDPPIRDEEVTSAQRGERAWASRLVDRPARPTRLCTVIAGPHEETCGECGGAGERISLEIPYGSTPITYACESCGGGFGRGKGSGVVRHACVLYTAFGGPAAPQEPGDPGCKDVGASTAFWREHALAK